MIRELGVPDFQKPFLVSMHILVIGHHYASYSLLASLQVLATFWRSGRLMVPIRLLWMPESLHSRLQLRFQHLLLTNLLHLTLLAS